MNIETQDSPRIRMTQVPRDRIMDLRRRVLQRPDALPGDDRITTWHFAAFPLDTDDRVAGEAVACGSYVFESLDERVAWRLNALATDPLYRGHRIGLKLLKWSEAVVAREEPFVNFFWCMAREKAISTYEQNGWICISDFIERPPFGRYRQMSKQH